MTIDEVKDFFEERDYNCGIQTFPIECTCRYGITWTDKWTGSYGELWRAWDLMRRCCCWVCHNHDCKEPRNEIIKNCGNSCELWSHTHYCEVYKLKNQLKEYKSILNQLYEDGDDYEEIPMYEKLIEETELKLNQLNKNG